MTDTDKNNKSTNERTERKSNHSPLFQKIIAARTAAGYNSLQPSTLNTAELQAVETLRESTSGETTTINNHGFQEVFVKG